MNTAVFFFQSVVPTSADVLSGAFPRGVGLGKADVSVAGTLPFTMQPVAALHYHRFTLASRFVLVLPVRHVVSLCCRKALNVAFDMGIS